MLSTLFNNDVRQTLDEFRRSVDEMFENFYGEQMPVGSDAITHSAWGFSPVVESAWNADTLLLRAILPGVSEDQVHVTAHNNELVVEGERTVPEGFDRNAFTQLAYGKFYTAVKLPAGLDIDHVNCRLHNGVLEIRVPLLETAKAKQIPIQSGEPLKAINA
jgi:HSP20 family protein